MSRQGAADTMRSGRAWRGAKSTSHRYQATGGSKWGGVTYRIGLSVFALAFFGVAIAISTGNQAVEIACITVAVAGGVVAGFELYRMTRNDLRLLWNEDPGDDGGGGGGGGWGRAPDPEVTPPKPDGLLPELDEPAWWPAFEQDLNSWVLDSSDTPGAGGGTSAS